MASASPAGVGLLQHFGPQFLTCSHHSVTWVSSILQPDCSYFIDVHPQVPFLTNKRLRLGVGELFPRAPDIWAIHTISRKAIPTYPYISGPVHPPPQAFKPRGLEGVVTFGEVGESQHPGNNKYHVRSQYVAVVQSLSHVWLFATVAKSTP